MALGKPISDTVVMVEPKAKRKYKIKNVKRKIQPSRNLPP
jgi:hypothetical protein